MKPDKLTLDDIATLNDVLIERIYPKLSVDTPNLNEKINNVAEAIAALEFECWKLGHMIAKPLLEDLED